MNNETPADIVALISAHSGQDSPTVVALNRNVVETVNAISVLTGDKVHEVVESIFAEELSIGSVKLHEAGPHLFVDPDDSSRTSMRQGRAAARWLKQYLDDGRKLSEFLNPNHPKYEQYREKMLKEEMQVELEDGITSAKNNPT